MKKIGFLISKKENEKRRAIIYDDLKKIKNKEFVFFEQGYGLEHGYTDDMIKKLGFNVATFEEIIEKCEILCDPKIGDANYLTKIKNKTLFGWIHATQNYNITQAMIDNKLTGYAWEKMNEGTRHVFYKNNELAGEAAVLHAMLTYGKNFAGLNAAIIGNGNTAKGAIKILNQIGANVTIYSRDKEQLLKNELKNYDIIVNCILWDVERKDHIISKNDIKQMKKNSIIIDVSCDRGGGIETSIPTTIENPTYQVEGVTHYVVDHTPSLLYKNATETISNEVVKYIDFFIEEKIKENEILKNSLIIENGKILDKEIIRFQNR